MLWVFSGIFYGFFMSLYTFINQKYKINGYVLGMWRGFGVAIISLPVFFLVPFEKSSVFYILLTLQGILTGMIQVFFLQRLNTEQGRRLKCWYFLFLFHLY